MPSAPVLLPPNSNEPPCVVLDNGSGLIKVGFAGAEVPKAVLPTSGLEGVSDDRRPLEHGIIRDWDAMEAYWDHAFTHLLDIDTEKVNVLLTANMFETKDNRERIVNTLFETFAVPNVYLTQPPVLELYAAGRENGVVLGMGAQVTSAVLVHEGLPDPRTLTRSKVAGEALTAWAAQTLAKGGAALDEAAACRAKEQLGAVVGASGVAPPAAATYELPDGRKLSVSAEQRGQLAEPLFQPTLVGEAGGGLAQLVFDCIKLRDRDGVLESNTPGLDGTAAWFASTVLAGGSSLFPGLPERLTEELAPLAPSHAKPAVLAPPERKHAAWLGGSILGSLAVMPSMWITKDEYDENGPLIVHRKTF
jgi:actin